MADTSGRGLQSNTIDLEMCVKLAKDTMADVDYEAEMVEKVCTQDSLLDVGDDEHPAAEAEVEGA